MHLVAIINHRKYKTLTQFQKKLKTTRFEISEYEIDQSWKLTKSFCFALTRSICYDLSNLTCKIAFFDHYKKYLKLSIDVSKLITCIAFFVRSNEVSVRLVVKRIFTPVFYQICFLYCIISYCTVNFALTAVFVHSLFACRKRCH